MQPNSSQGEDTFDRYASSYDEALEKGICVSGENKLYFAERRIQWLAAQLERRKSPVKQILDFGCGTGSATPYLAKYFSPEKIVGVDSSAGSISVARSEHSRYPAEFGVPSDYPPRGSFDLVFCNGVFHHIPATQRTGVLEYIRASLRPSGFFALWENNPLNPGTRYIMSRIPFDRDAETLLPWEARKMVLSAGFTAPKIDFLFIFPRMFKVLRPLEPVLSCLPVGAQYQVLSLAPSAEV